MRTVMRVGELRDEGLGSPSDLEALSRLIDYAVVEAMRQDLPITARVLGLARESLASPTVVGSRLGGPESLNPELKGQALQ